MRVYLLQYLQIPALYLLPLHIALLYLVLHDVLQQLLLGTGLSQRVLIEHEVLVQLLQQLVVALDLVEHLLRGLDGGRVALVLVIDEQVEGFDHIDLYLLVDGRDLLRQLVQDVDDVLAQENYALVLRLVDL